MTEIKISKLNNIILFFKKGSSHQFWHLCVLIAIILTYFGSLEVLYSRKRAECYI